MDDGQNGFHIHSASLTICHDGGVNTTVHFYAAQKLMGMVTVTASERVNSPLGVIPTSTPVPAPPDHSKLYD